MGLEHSNLYMMLLGLSTLLFLVAFFPVGILFGIIFLYFLYKRREPQRLVLEAQRRAEREARIAQYNYSQQIKKMR